MKKVKKAVKLSFVIVLLFTVYNCVRIYNYSFQYSEESSDVAIVLGAGTEDGVVSPVFRERINHSVYLYEHNYVSKIILTGGYGKNQKISDSRAAKKYAISKGVADDDVLIEEYSHYTYQNLKAAKHIMDSLDFSSALVVSDPLHMKRAMDQAIRINLNCKPSPTKTSMYKSIWPKIKSLGYETFFYTAGKIMLRF